MSPVTHGLLSWLLANTPGVDHRGRLAVTLAGLAPDVDGFGYPFEALTRDSAHPIEWFHRFHHHLMHNLPACAVVGLAAWAFAGRSWLVAGLAFAAAVGHLLCDLVGARGPDGYPWPIPFLQPFDDRGWSWSGQWGLSSWQNAVITIAAVIATLTLAWARGFSPVGLVSKRADGRVVEALRQRLGTPSNGA